VGGWACLVQMVILEREASGAVIITTSASVTIDHDSASARGIIDSSMNLHRMKTGESSQDETSLQDVSICLGPSNASRTDN
jgi:hypothetical protein